MIYRGKILDKTNFGVQRERGLTYKIAPLDTIQFLQKLDAPAVVTTKGIDRPDEPFVLTMRNNWLLRISLELDRRVAQGVLKSRTFWSFDPIKMPDIIVE